MGAYSAAGASAPTIDPAGSYSAAGASALTTDPAGTYSGAGASAPTPAAAGAYVFNTAESQYGLDRLFLTYDNNVPLNEVLSFNSETAVANFFGEGSQEATLATDFFSGYAGSSGNMLFARLPVGAAERACLGKY